MRNGGILRNHKVTPPVGRVYGVPAAPDGGSSAACVPSTIQFRPQGRRSAGLLLGEGSARVRKSLLLLVFVFGGVVGTAPAKAKKEAPLSKAFCNAQYVHVQTYEGDLDPMSARQYPSDYDAMVGVQNRIERWGRYKLADPLPSQPVDLIFVVWKERKTGNRYPGQPTEMPPAGGPRGPGPGTGPGGPGQNPGQPGQPTGPGQGPGTGNGPGDIEMDGAGVGGVFPISDQLAVYMPLGDQNLSAPLWKHSEKDGLKEPDMPLFRQLADAVDDACSDVNQKP
jgi:hypothetical protein